MLVKRIVCVLVATLISIPVLAQSEAPKYEYRGVWVATVSNLDWPSSGRSSVSFQKQDLINQLDELKAAGLNVVFFQIRTEGDALYDSPTEPWSRYLTGTEGKAPDPYWDPLEFAIEEAHKRGMELHAWLNPYRAMRSVPSDFSQKRATSSGYEIADHLESFLAKEKNLELEHSKRKGTQHRDEKHVSNTHPEWLLIVNDFAIFDPGLPEVMDYTVDIVMDVVNRYDIDGIHFDDYFYPYAPNEMTSRNPSLNALDDETFQSYPRGFTNKGDWRRNNVNMLVSMINDSINVVKPWVEFGISPFGIWKSGVPSGISGTSGYSSIYADGVAWLEDKSIDYITPQLYWTFNRFGAKQDYAKLSNWWADRAAENDRHIYPGHGLYKSDRSTFANALFDADEIPRQVQHNRDNEDIGGSVFFRSKNITRYSSKGFADSLKNNYYKYPALQPIMAWKDTSQPNTPQNLVVNQSVENEYEFELSWDRPALAPHAKRRSATHVDSLVKYAIYRVDSPSKPSAADALEAMKDARNLVAVTGQTEYPDVTPPSQGIYWYFITSATRNSVESEPTPVEVGGFVVSKEEEFGEPMAFKLSQNYPNPFNPTTNVQFVLPENGFTSLKVYDMLGREVSTLINKNMPAGAHTVNFDASKLSSGIYIYKLEMGEQSLTKKMTLIK